MVELSQAKRVQKTNARKPNHVDQHVAKRMRSRRGLLGMSQEELAKRLGITAQQIQKYEAGETRISASRLFAIGQQLGIPISWFFEELEYGNAPSLNVVNSDAQSAAQKPANDHLNQLLHEPEARDLLKTYFTIKDTELRKKVLDMAALLTQIPK